MIQIGVNKEIVKILRNYSINSDYMGSCLIVLYSLYNKDYALLDELDSENSDLLFLHIYKDLEMKDVLIKTSEESDVHFELTDSGVLLMQEILKASENKAISQKKSIDVSWILEWLDLWRDSRGLFYKGKYSLGASSKDAKEKFIKFFASYGDIFNGIDEDDIKNILFQVTKEYIRKEKEKGFEYTRKAINYISKVESGCKGSDLAMACEEFINQKKSAHVETVKINSYNSSIN